MLGLAVVLALTSLSAGATDVDFNSLDQLYWHRNEGRNLDEHLSRIDALLAGADPSDPQLQWRKCRALIRRGEKREKKSDRIDAYASARGECGKSLAAAPDSAGTHFWLGVAMGRWGEAKGVLRSLFLIRPIRREMQAALRLDPGYGGAHRVLGEMLWQIPGFAGGDKKKAIEEFEAAVRLWPDHIENYQSLAKAYLHFGRRDDAVRVLNAVVSAPAPADPAEYPDALADARKTLADLSAR